MTHLLRLALLIFAGMLPACTAPPPPPPAHGAAHLDAAATTRWLAAQTKPARFVGDNGQMHGLDNDYALELQADHQAELTLYGVAVQHFPGNYVIHEDGTLSFAFQNYRGKWPAMYLQKTAHGMYLFPTTFDPKFKADGRPGVVGNSHWLFRQAATR